MIKIIVFIAFLAFIDLKGVAIRENKKEVVLYLLICLITMGIGFYYVQTGSLSIVEFLLKTLP